MDDLDEVYHKLNYLLKEQDILSKELIFLARQQQRIEFFFILRGLINEKNKENDQTAANILGWAYERLAED